MRQRSAVPLLLLISVTVAALLTRHIVTQARDSNGAPGSEARAELGRLLFWDPILSGHQDIACATCHHPDFAYADGRDLSRGTRGVGLGPARVDTSNGQIPVAKRNSPTILNTAFNGLDDDDDRRRARPFDGTVASVDQVSAPMFWDKRVRIAVAPQRRADRSVHAQRDADNARGRAALLRQRPLREPQRFRRRRPAAR